MIKAKFKIISDELR